jgi:beta-N-acetylhexosaminidase
MEPAEVERLKHPAVGGVILFSRNYETPEQLGQLVAYIRDIRAGLLVAVDHEGGRVQRFRNGFTSLPPASAYGRIVDRGAALHASRTAGWLMAAELRSVDIDFSFAPVLDVDCGISHVIGNRSFSDQPGDAASLATAFFLGMQDAGMAAVGKHFPGHGSVAADSHTHLPVDNRSWPEIQCRDLEPFKALIEAGIQGMMPAHVVYSRCDDYAAGFSPFWIGEVLRQRLAFDGAVFSDDLSMAGAAVAGELTSRAEAALAAGCDMALICNIAERVDPVLEVLADVPGIDRQRRLDAMRGRFAIDRAGLLRSAQWHDAVSIVERLTESGCQ